MNKTKDKIKNMIKREEELSDSVTMSNIVQLYRSGLITVLTNAISVLTIGAPLVLLNVSISSSPGMLDSIDKEFVLYVIFSAFVILSLPTVTSLYWITTLKIVRTLYIPFSKLEGPPAILKRMAYIVLLLMPLIIFLTGCFFILKCFYTVSQDYSIWNNITVIILIVLCMCATHFAKKDAESKQGVATNSAEILKKHKKGNMKGSRRHSLDKGIQVFEQVYTTIYEEINGVDLYIGKNNDTLYIFEKDIFFRYEDLISGEAESSIEGLVDWLKECGQYLQNNMSNHSMMIGQWIGDNQEYNELTANKFIMSKRESLYSTIDGSFNSYIDRNSLNIETFKWGFEDEIVPEFITVSPVVEVLDNIPSHNMLDKLYEEYSSSVDRDVKGFIFTVENQSVRYEK